MYFYEIIMTKADWLDFFEAINGRSATEEEIAAALAAGEFQDDVPAVETAPARRQRNQPLVPKKHLHKRRSHSRLSLMHKRRNNRLSLVHKKHNHSQLSLRTRGAANSQLSLVHKKPQPQSSFFKCSGCSRQPTCRPQLLQCKEANQAVQPQVGFANAQAGQQAAFC